MTLRIKKFKENPLENTMSMTGSIQAFQHNQREYQMMGMPQNNKILYHLINIRACNMNVTDKLWEALTRLICFTTCIADHLWIMLSCKQERVHVYLFPILLRKLIYLIE